MTIVPHGLCRCIGCYRAQRTGGAVTGRAERKTARIGTKWRTSLGVLLGVGVGVGVETLDVEG